MGKCSFDWIKWTHVVPRWSHIQAHLQQNIGAFSHCEYVLCFKEPKGCRKIYSLLKTLSWFWALVIPTHFGLTKPPSETHAQGTEIWSVLIFSLTLRVKETFLFSNYLHVFFFTQKLQLFPADLKRRMLILTAVQTRLGLYSDRSMLHYCTLAGVRWCPRGDYVHGPVVLNH